MKPLIYGYLRVTPGMPDNDLEQLELVLRDYAEHEGYCFAATFHEYVSGSQSTFSELIEELQRVEAHHIIVPTSAAPTSCSTPPRRFPAWRTS